MLCRTLVSSDSTHEMQAVASPRHDHRNGSQILHEDTQSGGLTEGTLAGRQMVLAMWRIEEEKRRSWSESLT